jgi:hypothetical protein
MGSKTLVRSVATGALAAAMASAGAGTAAAAPPERSTSAYATTFLSGKGFTAIVTLTETKGIDPVADIDIFVDGYRCEPVDPVAFTLETLESASVVAEDVELNCVFEGDGDGPGEQPPPVTGTADIDLTFLGVGEVERIPLNGRLDHCVGRFLERDASVEGRVTVDFDGETSQLVVNADSSSDTALRYTHTVCPPGRP